MVILAVIVCYNQYFKVSYEATISLNKIQLPQHIKHEFFNSDPNPNIMLVNIYKNKINYYYNGNNTNRSNIILKSLYKIVRKYKNVIPNSNYFISLQDGVHKKFSYPVLAFAATHPLVANNQVVLLPDTESLKGYDTLVKTLKDAALKYPWLQKSAKILWRGATTGGKDCTTYNCSARLNFINSSVNLEFVDAGFTLTTSNVSKKFAQEIRLKHFKNHVTPQDSLAYKYLLDIDGNSCSYSRMAWILSSNSLLLKHQSDKIQWYYHKLKPYEHYIPIASDFHNLQQQYEWAETHPTEVQGMINNAQQLAQEIFSAAAIEEAFIEALARYQQILPQHLR